MLLVSNWKTYIGTLDEAKKLFSLAKKLAVGRKVKIVLASPAPFISLLAHNNKTNVTFGAQDISASSGSKATGEVSGEALVASGARFVIVGHSERRAMGESDEVVKTKIEHAHLAGLTPILCVGETERDSNANYLSFLKKQLASVFEPLRAKDRTNIIVAYEPVWAIGKTGADALAPHDLTEMVLYIRKILAEYVGSAGSFKVKVIYGGSVEEGNIKSLCDGTGVDGFLIGHASADAVAYTALVKAIS